MCVCEVMCYTNLGGTSLPVGRLALTITRTGSKSILSFNTYTIKPMERNADAFSLSLRRQF